MAVFGSTRLDVIGVEGHVNNIATLRHSRRFEGRMDMANDLQESKM
jgi:hypothetical protein